MLAAVAPARDCFMPISLGIRLLAEKSKGQPLPYPLIFFLLFEENEKRGFNFNDLFG